MSGKDNTVQDAITSIRQSRSNKTNGDIVHDTLSENYVKEYSAPSSRYVRNRLIDMTKVTDTDRTEKLYGLLREYKTLQIEGKDTSIVEADILAMGWIPGIPYNNTSRSRAGLLEYSTMSKYEIIDQTKDDELDDSSPLKRMNKYNPVYIVLVEGDKLFSKITRMYTNGPYSHAGICTDNKFQNIYSFNMDPKMAHGKIGGFSIEKLSDYNNDCRLGIFAIFVKDKDLKKIEDTFNKYLDNAKNTSYSILNILALPFNAPIKMDFNMICSEFVDNVLKLANIDIIDKASPLVTPNDIYRAYMTNKKIYKVYEGMVKNFKPTTLAKRISNIKKQYIKESVLVETEFPVQFSADGDLLIKNKKKMNYDKEVAKSNTLLKIYYKEDDRGGMKYELARLYFILNTMLDDDRLSQKELNRTKSVLINILTNYTRLLIDREKNFNLEEYYKSTPFSDETTIVRKSTITTAINILKAVVSP